MAAPEVSVVDLAHTVSSRAGARASCSDDVVWIHRERLSTLVGDRAERSGHIMHVLHLDPECLGRALKHLIETVTTLHSQGVAFQPTFKGSG